MKRMVVDSNFLQDDKLREYLSASPSNKAVIIDYAEMEALNGGPDVLLKSTEILAEFPKQVVLAKTTDVVSALAGKSKGLKKRFTDGKRSTGFRRWFRKGRVGLKRRDKTTVVHLGAQASEAAARLDVIEKGAAHFAADLEDAAKQFTRDELRILRNKERLTPEMVDKIIDRVFHFALRFFDAHPGIKQLPTRKALLHTFIFRYSLCATMHALRWMAAGGAKGAGQKRIRNDIVDVTFAAYGLCFDGLLTKDGMASEIYDNAKFMLDQFLSQEKRHATGAG
jgi:hypothetical protein